MLLNQRTGAKFGSLIACYRPKSQFGLPIPSRPYWLKNEIQKAREAQGWSRKELGGFLNLSADYIGKLERGDRTITAELEPKLRKLLHL
ncbi:helix-turn-helix domain-containing protein [Leptodesmis sp.]|uniref:helix-turn-helix domain-containing protein n=1 Tax=Leptodesmis sp. TaxID=3100501 RepID=UPI004053584D